MAIARQATSSWRSIITTPVGNLIPKSTRTRSPPTLPMTARKGVGRHYRHRAFTNGAYLTEVYGNCLAREVRSLGYEIENRREAKGRDCGFEIQGVSAALLRKYSQRSRQRDEAIRQFVERNGRQPSDREIAVLVRETRAEKLAEISTQEVRARQRARLPEAGCHRSRA